MVRFRMRALEEVLNCTTLLIWLYMTPKRTSPSAQLLKSRGFNYD